MGGIDRIQDGTFRLTVFIPFILSISEALAKLLITDSPSLDGRGLGGG